MSTTGSGTINGSESGTTAGLAQLIETILGGDLPVAVACYDGSVAGPQSAPATLVVRPGTSATCTISCDPAPGS